MYVLYPGHGQVGEVDERTEGVAELEAAQRGGGHRSAAQGERRRRRRLRHARENRGPSVAQLSSSHFVRRRH